MLIYPCLRAQEWQAALEAADVVFQVLHGHEQHAGEAALHLAANAVGACCCGC